MRTDLVWVRVKEGGNIVHIRYDQIGAFGYQPEEETALGCTWVRTVDGVTYATEKSLDEFQETMKDALRMAESIK